MSSRTFHCLLKWQAVWLCGCRANLSHTRSRLTDWNWTETVSLSIEIVDLHMNRTELFSIRERRTYTLHWVNIWFVLTVSHWQLCLTHKTSRARFTVYWNGRQCDWVDVGRICHTHAADWLTGTEPKLFHCLLKLLICTCTWTELNNRQAVWLGGCRAKLSHT